MTSVSAPPSTPQVPTQADDQKAINEAGQKALKKLGVVSAQADVAIGAAKAGLGLQKTKDYLTTEAQNVGNTVEKTFRCSAAELVFQSITKMAPAETPESPLIEGAQKTLGVAEANLAAIAGVRTALGKKISEVPVNLDCTPPKKEEKSN
ncbi:MAG: hypothetical protein ACAI38_22475 [Myxococcota bacterium]|nr:hypothetical protein [Myxococcota bacterium]